MKIEEEQKASPNQTGDMAGKLSSMLEGSHDDDPVARFFPDVDESVSPGDDFYRFVNGQWLDTFELPGDKIRFGSFDAIHEANQKKLFEIIEALSKKTEPMSEEEARIVAMYQSFMDFDHRNAEGVKPIEAILNESGAITNKAGLIPRMAELTTLGVNMPFDFGVMNDPKNPESQIVHITQAGLGLPDRDYYLEDGEKYEKIREAYKRYIIKLFELEGIEFDLAEYVADIIFDLETVIARIQMSQADSRDTDKTYNKMTVDELEALTPNIPWNFILRNNSLGGATEVIVHQVEYLKSLNHLFSKVSFEAWQAYSQFQQVNAFASFLSQDYVDARFDFYGKALSGAKEQKPVWEQAVRAVDARAAQDLGQIYAEKYFPESSKVRMLELIENLKLAFREVIADISWMDDSTKAVAMAKLDNLRVKIGFPDKWEDREGLSYSPESYVGNVLAARRFAYEKNCKELGKPVDREKWHMPPQMVNAYCDPETVEICFPAGILQPPFFDPDAPDAVNYGGIGVVIGHEISHLFDDEGRKYDANGELRDWWTPDDAKNFEARVQRLVEQYSAFEPMPGEHINGELTLGENLADLIGLRIAHRAYQIAHGDSPEADLGTYTPPQQFLMNYARVWKGKCTEGYLTRQLRTDPHSPGEFRTKEVSNLDMYHEAFDVKEGDAMYREPEDRVRVWFGK